MLDVLVDKKRGKEIALREVYNMRTQSCLLLD